MGRSVNYLNDSLHIAYIYLESDGDVPKCEHCESKDVVCADNENGDYLCSNCEEVFEWHAYDPQMEWDNLKESLYEILGEYPSLDLLKGKNRGWEGNDVSIIAENCHCEIGLSEYCGLVSVSIRVNDTNFRCMPMLAMNWINQIWPGLEKKLNLRFNTLIKMGTFSNGESVYRSIK